MSLDLIIGSMYLSNSGLNEGDLNAEWSRERLGVGPDEPGAGLIMSLDLIIGSIYRSNSGLMINGLLNIQRE